VFLKMKEHMDDKMLFAEVIYFGSIDFCFFALLP